MIASDAGVRPDELARQLFSVVTHFCLSLPRGRRRAGDLKEIEFLTLSILSNQGTMIVGDIQRLLGVLPAQMSRIIRSLEGRDRPYIVCRINPQDKRKIDVCLTAAGDKALADYREHRVRGIADLLSKLPEHDLEDVHTLLDKLQLLPERAMTAPETSGGLPPHILDAIRRRGTLDTVPPLSTTGTGGTMRKCTAAACLALFTLGCDYTFREEVTYEGRTAEEWVQLTKDEDVELRRKAVTMLGEIGPIEADRSIPALAQATADEDVQVRLLALQQLEKLAPKAKKAQNAVTKAFADKNKRVAKQALKTFKAIEMAKPSALNGN